MHTLESLTREIANLQTEIDQSMINEKEMYNKNGDKIIKYKISIAGIEDIITELTNQIKKDKDNYNNGRMLLYHAIAQKLEMFRLLEANKSELGIKRRRMYNMDE